MKSKITCVISSPFDTYSGYGAKSRDFIRAVKELKGDDWDIKLLSQRWGNLPFGFVDDHKDTWGFLNDMVVTTLTEKPDVWIQITVPTEFSPIGKFNIGVTAVVETNICPPQFLEGVNRMNHTLVPSNFSKQVLQDSAFKKLDERTGQELGVIKLERPVDVIFEGVDTNVYGSTGGVYLPYIKELQKVPEHFGFLFVGHWMQGMMGEDRKNVGLMVKLFYETFKNKPNPPFLLLKTSSSGCSYMDRTEIQNRLKTIRSTVEGYKLPPVYLLHGDFTDEQMSNIYNNPKIKAMLSMTKGEGFGRPLLEFSLTGKPIITTNWSGHTDFLNKDYATLVGGELKQVHESAAVENLILKEASWFSADPSQFSHAMTDMVKNYKAYKKKASVLAKQNKKNYSYEAMKEKLGEFLDRNTPEFPKEIQLKLPDLKTKVELPTLK